ncbi:putative permease, YjgP/YjgQ family [Bartonella clarridgeiae 73]|uniref:Putative permease, YjgP/YjgQ family n=1 Tax=Bartonella clarridgeiae (strain CCUG 45776 / CIP 104772 / 73) TaxID=696125 RepID=E6YHA3_BARC7|nr:LPS export ABC transporter permease LptF [Bartonella clarridgeiae]WCR55179.1 MAG: Lipopolysaccharide export system permease protein LptF [Bartonella clarridgeiae]CBI76241.1 putative permease, YjgP/YjgQ family [Bartonella clarridgeiae 73]
MRILELYILKRIFLLFSAVMIGAIGISWTVQILARINFLTTSGQTFLTVLHFSSLLIPSVTSLVMPFGLVIAITIILSTMNQDSELAVISASGIPKNIIWKPILLLAILTSLTSFSITNFIAPNARLNMRQMLANTHSDLINLFIREGSFQELTKNLYIEIGETNTNGTIGRLFIADQRDRQFGLFYYAKKGIIVNNKKGNFLILNDGEIERIDYKNDNVSIIKFSSHTFSLSEFITNKRTPNIYPKDRPLSYLSNPDPNDPHYQRKPLQYRAEFHRRLTECLYPIVFALIAVAIAGDARSYRQTHISSTFSVISFSLLIYWLGYFFAKKTENNPVYIPLLYIIPIGISILTFFMLLTNCKIFVLAKFNDTIQKIFQKKSQKIDL